MPSAFACNCTKIVQREGELIKVRSWAWDCPSCGADKRRAIVAAGESAGARRIVTLTFEQPHSINPDGDFLEPSEFLGCDPATHCYVYRDGSERWRRIPSCALCLGRVSAMLTLWRKRVRRKYPALQALRVYETHKSGALHVHVLVTGLPWNMTRSSPSAAVVKSAWAEVGGGFVDVGHDERGREGSRRAAGYASKYITKAAGRALAKGYRAWTRTAGFGPEVRIPGSSERRIGPVCGPFRPQVVWGGWWDLDLDCWSPHRPERRAEPAPT